MKEFEREARFFNEFTPGDGTETTDGNKNLVSVITENRKVKIEMNDRLLNFKKLLIF